MGMARTQETETSLGWVELHMVREQKSRPVRVSPVCCVQDAPRGLQDDDMISASPHVPAEEGGLEPQTPLKSSGGRLLTSAPWGRTKQRVGKTAKRCSKSQQILP